MEREEIFSPSMNTIISPVPRFVKLQFVRGSEVVMEILEWPSGGIQRHLVSQTNCISMVSHGQKGA